MDANGRREDNMEWDGSGQESFPPVAFMFVRYLNKNNQRGEQGKNRRESVSSAKEQRLLIKVALYLTWAF